MADVIGPIIAKQGTITILKSVPWDRAYKNVLMPPSNPDNQYNVVTQNGGNIVVNNLGAQSYSRISENTVRIQVSADKIKHCNYMIINNGSGFGYSKYFYCFITNVEYVNVNTCDVKFELDYFQTYYYDFVFEDSFVEREHSESDGVGDNLVPENLELGDLIVQATNHKRWTSFYTVILYVPNPDHTDPYVYYDSNLGQFIRTNHAGDAEIQEEEKPSYLCRYGSGIYALPAGTDLPNRLAQGIKKLNDAGATIVAMFKIPYEMYHDNFTSSQLGLRFFTFGESSGFKYLHKSGSYNDVCNNKLYQYPFRRLVVTNGDGQEAEYKWELFSFSGGGNPTATLYYLHTLCPQPTTTLFPANYRGLDKDYENAVYVTNFPQPSWSEDSFSKWWSQNQASFSMSLITSFLSSAMMIGASGGAGQIVEDGLSGRQAMSIGFGAQRVTGLLSQASKARATPDSANIQSGNGVVNDILGILGFSIYDVGLTGEMAEVIDDYFSMFGYACNRIKQPSFKGAHRRKFFNYIKTKGCCLQAQTGAGRGTPNEAIEFLEKLFDNGTTVWYDYDKVGDYENYKQGNTPL